MNESNKESRDQTKNQIFKKSKNQMRSQTDIRINESNQISNDQTKKQTKIGFNESNEESED